MLKSKTKFKVEDKVRILLSATDVGVLEGEVGSIGRVISLRDRESSCRVQMFKSHKGRTYIWSVNYSQIEPIFKVGRQQLFSFME